MRDLNRLLVKEEKHSAAVRIAGRTAADIQILIVVPSNFLIVRPSKGSS